MNMAVVRAVVVDRTLRSGALHGRGKATPGLACGLFAACAVALAAAAALPASAAKRAPKPASTQTASMPVARPTPFSSGPLAATAPPGWAVQTLPKVQRQTFYDLVPEDGTIVLRGRADASASSLRHGLFVDPKAMPILRWRWRTARVLQGGDMTTKEGDDYAARLYVFFDRDPETMTFKERTLLKLGRARYGDQLPAAALCYVWDNRHPVGTIMDNAYTPFVAMVVASSGDAQVGRWQTLQRDVREDYKRAFNADPPRIIGVAVSVDTDNTGESTTTWFGDIEFVAGAKR
jgi:Protein of unknown function (DUF3047)